MANIDERIKQCKADIKVLKEQEQQLLDEKNKKEELKAGDVVSIDGYSRLIIRINGCDYAVGKYGFSQSSPSDPVWKNYKKIGTCTGFTVA